MKNTHKIMGFMWLLLMNLSLVVIAQEPNWLYEGIDVFNGADEEITLEECQWVPPSEDLVYLPFESPADKMTSSFDRTPESVHRIVNRFHVIRRANGTSEFDEALIPALMQDLNYGFRNTPFVFVREPGVVYVDNDAYFNDFPTFSSAFDMLNANFQEGVMSWYIVPCITNCTSAAGTWIGPASQVRGILMTYAITGSPARMVTPVHEMGHIFQIHHPYLSVFGTECTSGSNCSTAGDLVCDTPASPLIFSANTTGTGIYFGNQVGPCPGDPVFAPNPKLYMDAGWAAGHILRDEFSQGQIDRAIRFVESPAGSLSVNDLIGPQRPNILVDCDTDGIDDIDEILGGDQLDVNKDLVPDVCQVFPNAGDLVVSGQNPGPNNRLRYYDAVTGEWRGDLWNGMTWAHQVRLGPDGLLYMARLTLIQRIDLDTGRTVDNFIDGVLEGAGTFVDLLFEASGDILVLDNVSRNVRRYDGSTGEFINVFINLNFLTGFAPKYMEYGPDGNVYVVGNGAGGNSVERFDTVSGQPMGSFVAAGSGGLAGGQGLVFHNDGFLYVSNSGGNNVLRFNSSSGAFDRAFVPTDSNGGLNNPHSLRFGPDGDLYVASRNTHSVKRYDGDTGAYLGDFVAPNSGGPPGTGGLNQPAGLLFTPKSGFPIENYHTGLWYNRDQSGHGLSVEILPGNRMVVYWYTYDNEGNQLWLSGVGAFENDLATLEVAVTKGAFFPPNFLASDVEISLWGEFQFKTTGCNDIMFSWTPAPGTDFTSGSMAMTRLTAVAGLSCTQQE